MFKVTSALPSARAKLKIQNRKFVEVLHNNPIFFFVMQPWLFPSIRLGLGYSVPCLSGTITHELCGFCYGDTPHQSNGEYSFHCALKDHNLEMLRVINNLLSCWLNETCILLTSESTKINCVWWKTSVSVFISAGHKQNECCLLKTCKWSARACYFNYVKRAVWKWKRWAQFGLHVMKMRRLLFLLEPSA